MDSQSFPLRLQIAVVYCGLQTAIILNVEVMVLAELILLYKTQEMKRTAVHPAVELSDLEALM